jgi:hypothetical protein
MIRGIAPGFITSCDRANHPRQQRLPPGNLENLRALAKHVVWFENSAHEAPFEDPALFDSKAVTELRPAGINSIR